VEIRLVNLRPVLAGVWKKKPPFLGFLVVQICFIKSYSLVKFSLLEALQKTANSNSNIFVLLKFIDCIFFIKITHILTYFGFASQQNQSYVKHTFFVNKI